MQVSFVSKQFPYYDIEGGKQYGKAYFLAFEQLAADNLKKLVALCNKYAIPLENKEAAPYYTAPCINIQFFHHKLFTQQLLEWIDMHLSPPTPTVIFKLYFWLYQATLLPALPHQQTLISPTQLDLLLKDYDATGTTFPSPLAAARAVLKLNQHTPPHSNEFVLPNKKAIQALPREKSIQALTPRHILIEITPPTSPEPNLNQHTPYRKLRY